MGGLTHKPARELTADGKTWYLADVRIANENGVLQWENLLRTEYRYCEIFAPNGYSLDETVRLANRFAAQTVTLTNKSGSVLPKTGGCGAGRYYALGTLLAAVAAVLLRRRRTGKEKPVK